jgi:hypothetical protein
MDEFAASCPNHSTLGERTPGTHWIRSRVNAKVNVDTVSKRIRRRRRRRRRRRKDLPPAGN